MKYITHKNQSDQSDLSVSLSRLSTSPFPLGTEPPHALKPACAGPVLSLVTRWAAASGSQLAPAAFVDVALTDAPGRSFKRNLYVVVADNYSWGCKIVVATKNFNMI